MRRYSEADELLLVLQSATPEWARAGLLSSGQAAALGERSRVPLRRAGRFLRLGLALFTIIAGVAAIGLVLVITDLRQEWALSLLAAMLGAAALAAADRVVGAFRFYRHGVEEALALGGVALLAVSAAVLVVALAGQSADGPAVAAGCGACAAAALFVYRRFGYQYAAVCAMVAAALTLTPFGVFTPPARRLIAAAVFGAVFVFAGVSRQRANGDLARWDAEVVRASALAGAYLALNIHALPDIVRMTTAEWFRWTTYVLTWAIPPLGVRLAVSERDRLLLRVGMAAALVSLMTNKAYLGWERQPWDPMLLGVLLVGAAVALRRWIASGPGCERAGFTPSRVLESEADAVGLVSLVSVAGHAAPERRPDTPDDRAFSGGRSGGAGGGAEF